MADVEPRTAQRRLARFAGSPVRSSLLSVPAAVGLDAVGLTPVGEVVGASVRQMSRIVPSGMGAYGTNRGGVRRVRLSTDSWSPFRTIVQTTNRGYATVLRRMLDEARAMGADGIVDIRLQRSLLDDALHEFTGTGTAVRAAGRTRPATPFTTVLPGSDVAKLMLGGWVPVEAYAAVEIGTCLGDYRTTTQVRRRNPVNVEVGAFTELLTVTRAAARSIIQRRIVASGADGGLLSGTSIRTWDEGPAAGAEVIVTGTAVARFGPQRPASSATLSIMPMRDARFRQQKGAR